MAGGEDSIFRPGNIASQQTGERLVVNEGRQSLDASLIGEFGITEPQPRRVPVGVRQDLVAQLVQTTRH